MSNELNPKLERLLVGLVAGTQGGSVDWEHIGETSFGFSAPGGTVVVESEDGDGNYPFRVRVLDEDGTELDSERSHVRTSDGGFRPRPYADLFTELYESARRNAMRIDPVLDSIFTELQSRLRMDEEPF